MKKLLFLIAICGFMFIGTSNPALTRTLTENPIDELLAPLPTVTVNFNFIPAQCAAQCCYVWQFKVYEYYTGGTPRLLATAYYDCTQSVIPVYVTPDSGYTYLFATMTAIGSSVCDPAPPYSNWTSNLYTIASPYKVDWWPSICG